MIRGDKTSKNFLYSMWARTIYRKNSFMLDFYTAPTPNGYKISIALEEMGLAYKLHVVNLRAGEQKTEGYLKINPNGKIPTLVDHSNEQFNLSESGAILVYLAEKSGQFYGHDDNSRYLILQWLMFQMSALGPMMGQANVFFRYMEEKIPAAITRYHNEIKRLFGVMDQQLSTHEFIAGDYSIADMACYPWVSIHDWSGVEIDGFPNLQNWYNKLSERPAILKAMQLPPPFDRNEIVKSAQKIITR